MITKPKITYVEEYNGEELDSYRNLEINDYTLEGNISAIDSCRFNKVSFNEANITSIIDAIFTNSSLANVKMDNKSIARVEFKGCNLTGLGMSGCLIKDVVFTDCNCTYMNFSNAKLKNVKFINCNLAESYFDESELIGVDFDKANLEYAEFNNTSLKNIDLSNSNLFGIRTDYFSIRGAIIDQTQAVDIVRLLNVKIKE